MRRTLLAAVLTATLTAATAPRCWAINGNALALNSRGTTSGSSATLAGPGFVGTYINVPDAGDGGSVVNLTLNASRAIGGAGPDPHVNIAVADSKFGHTLGTTATNVDTGDMWLPSGRYFVRVERDSPNNPTSSSRTALIHSLDVTGATFSNVNNEANALAAADTYIEHFRQGPASVSLVGAVPGSEVGVRLKRHAFNWGANVHGTNTALFSNSQYTDFFKTNFNMVVPSRAGKWNNNESTRNVVTSVTGNGYLNTMLSFAEANDMRARLHNLIWANSPGAEQPSWAINMLNNPDANDPLTGSTNLAALRQEISERIQYYVGGHPTLPNLSLRYQEVDIYNESWHTGVNASDDANYWGRYGAAGVASIYEEAAQAAASAGSNAGMHVNEYNVFNWNDQYGNWYRDHILEIQNADGNPANGPVGGVGIQVYLGGTGGGAFQPIRAMQAMQNLSVMGLPMSITEFGVSGSTPADAAMQYVNQLMRMSFGHPDMTTFMYWGFWGGGTDFNAQGASILVDADWNLTDIGRMYQDMLGIQDWDGDPTNGWSTDLTLAVGPDGTIDFTGFFGDYEVTIDGQTFDLELVKGTTAYAVSVGDFLAGDFNGDGVVDAADYTRWRDSVGTETVLPNDDIGGTIGPDHFARWRDNFGASLDGGGSASLAQVPEPAAGVLLMWIVAVALVSERKRRAASKSLR